MNLCVKKKNILLSIFFSSIRDKNGTGQQIVIKMLIIKF